MIKRFFYLIIILFAQNLAAQLVNREINPEIDYTRTPRTYYI